MSGGITVTVRRIIRLVPLQPPPPRTPAPIKEIAA